MVPKVVAALSGLGRGKRKDYTWVWNRNEEIGDIPIGSPIVFATPPCVQEDKLGFATRCEHDGIESRVCTICYRLSLVAVCAVPSSMPP